MSENKPAGNQSGGVHISGGSVQAQNIAGRDIHIGAQISNSQVSQIFQPVADAIRTVHPDNQPDALQKLESLKLEAARGQHADHTVMTTLVHGIVDLVPGALKSLAAAFATPLLSGVSGPVTQFLLSKLLGQ